MAIPLLGLGALAALEALETAWVYVAAGAALVIVNEKTGATDHIADLLTGDERNPNHADASKGLAQERAQPVFMAGARGSGRKATVKPRAQQRTAETTGNDSNCGPENPLTQARDKVSASEQKVLAARSKFKAARQAAVKKYGELGVISNVRPHLQMVRAADRAENAVLEVYRLVSSTFDYSGPSMLRYSMANDLPMELSGDYFWRLAYQLRTHTTNLPQQFEHFLKTEEPVLHRYLTTARTYGEAKNEHEIDKKELQRLRDQSDSPC